MPATGKTLTGNLENGKGRQSLLALQQRDIFPEDFAAIGTDQAIADAVAETLKKFRPFATPEEQIATILAVNEAAWKDESITEAAIKALGNPPSAPESDESGFYCVTLVNDTGDVIETIKRNLAALQFVHGKDKVWKWDGIVLTPKGIRLRDSAKLRPKGLRWIAAELGRAYQSRKVMDVRIELDKNGLMGLGAEGILVAALHRRWAVSTNGEDKPFLDLPDLEVAPFAVGGFFFAPCVRWAGGDGRVSFGARHVGNADPYFGSGSVR